MLFLLMNCELPCFLDAISKNAFFTQRQETINVFPNFQNGCWFHSEPRTFVAFVAQKIVNLFRCMKTTRGSVQVLPEAMTEEISLKDLQQAAVAGFRVACTDDDVTASAQTEGSAKLEFLGDINLVSEEQKDSLMRLKEPQKYTTMKLKLVTW